MLKILSWALHKPKVDPAPLAWSRWPGPDKVQRKGLVLYKFIHTKLVQELVS